MTTNEKVMAIVSDVENRFYGNRAAKMRAIFEVMREDGIDNEGAQRRACEVPELWADTPTGQVNKGAIYNEWKKWHDRALGIATNRPRAPRTIAPVEVGCNYNEFTFGVEFECGFKTTKNYSSREAAVAALINKAQRFGVEVVDYGTANHRDLQHGWKVCSDASLHSSDKLQYMVEIVSPVLKGKEGWAELEKMCAVMELVGITVNDSCGTHVHLGVKDEVWSTLRNVGINYSLAYKAYCKALHKSRRHDNCVGRDWAAPYNERQVETLRNYASVDDLYEVGGMFHEATRSGHYPACRYYAVNYVAYYQRKTLEFRQHQGTVDFRKVQSWLKDKMELITWSRNNCLTGYTDDIEAMAWQSDDTRCNFIMRSLRYA